MPNFNKSHRTYLIYIVKRSLPPSYARVNKWLSTVKVGTVVITKFKQRYLRDNILNEYPGVYILVENGYLFPPPPLGNLYFFPKKTAWFSRNIADDK
jgi:hypothetical protein